jgi:4-amino-4-deoxy-L-arabinose transferase-like glycosyltransferase
MKSASILTRLDHIQINAVSITFPKLMVLLFALSLLIHGSVVALFINQPIALDDMFQYDMLARSLKDGNGFRWYTETDIEILRPYYSQFLDLDHLVFPVNGLITTFRAPGYPFFLAFMYLFTPEVGRFIFARLAQVILAAMLAPLSAILGHQAGFSRKVCIRSALCLSLYPILLFYPIGLASENLYILLGLASVILIYLSTKRASWIWVILAGLACGLTMFTRSIFAVSTLLSGVWIGVSSPYRKNAGWLFLLIAFGVCIPWSIRNSFIMRQPVFVENSAGYNMFIGYHPKGDGGFVSRIAILPMSILDDGERNSYCMQQAIQFIRQNPTEAMRRIWIRLIKYLGAEDREFFFFYSNNFVGEIPQPWITLIYSLLVIPWAATLYLGIIGLWQNRKKPLAQFVILFILGYAFPHFFIIAEPRFHFAWVPILLPFSVYGWDSIKKIRGNRILKGNNLILMIILICVTFIFVSGFLVNYPRLLSILSEGGNQLRFSY